MKESSQEYYLRGSSVSEGVAIGKLHILTQVEEVVPVFTIRSEEVDGEIQRYRQALSSSRKDLQHLQSSLLSENSEEAQEAMDIIGTHIEMLEDPLITTVMEQKIGQMLQNTESVFHTVMGDYEEKFNAIKDVFFRQRWEDIKDLSQRILNHLYPKHGPICPTPANAVLFARELAPSHTAEACVSKVGAFISEIGGKTSHAALIAKAKGIPYVANIDKESLSQVEGKEVIVDGIFGKIIINPTEETLRYYRKLQKDLLETHNKLTDELSGDIFTKDHKKIGVFANVDEESDLETSYFKRIEGVGLFRSEFLFLHKDLLESSEEEQFELYSNILSRTQNKPFVFRVFDIGSDKRFLHQPLLDEPNPALGFRALRFLMQNKGIFEKQLRAVFRASRLGKVSLLFPLVTDLDEWRDIKHFVNQVKKDVNIEEKIPLGCMIEVPSAVLCAESLIKECDFFSIGTNDLTQYTLAIDRVHSIVNSRYKAAHPAILKMIKHVVDIGKKYQKSVSLCGEIASNPLFIKLLIGLGVELFSCPIRHVPIITKTVKGISYDQAKEFADRILEIDSALEIERLLTEDYSGHY